MSDPQTHEERCPVMSECADISFFASQMIKYSTVQLQLSALDPETAQGLISETIESSAPADLFGDQGSALTIGTEAIPPYDEVKWHYYTVGRMRRHAADVYAHALRYDNDYGMFNAHITLANERLAIANHISHYALQRCLGGTMNQRKYIVGAKRQVCGTRIKVPMALQLNTIFNATETFLNMVDKYEAKGLTDDNFPALEVSMRYGI